jgi:hypothetical protein
MGSPLLDQKLSNYKSAFELACGGLFGTGSGGAVTLEYDDDTEEATAQSKKPAAEDFDSAATVAVTPDLGEVKGELDAALRFIAADFTQGFNVRLSELAKQDPLADEIAGRYQINPQHAAELESGFCEPIVPLYQLVENGDLDGARKAAVEAWTPLERRIREKWQAYYVLTFQDINVEMKAERDRKRLQHPGAGVDRGQMERPSTGQPMPKLSLGPDFAAQRTWEKPPSSVSALQTWLFAALVAALMATAGLFLIFHARH